ncbi:molybdenum cofactor guanylyltransferase [Sphingomonas sp. GCM10030256]|uniref:molybdenum cofactor guanylyltransferase n=1 Tax=Sphingomonas sp. GCM10030256 TaxID=3273427 RepID=UPI00360DA32C
MIYRNADASRRWSMPPMRLMIVILAGGESRRMGGGKPLRMLGSETLVARALRRACGWSGNVRLALRSPGQVPEPGAPVLLDDPEIGGPLAGLAAAARAAEADGCSHLLSLPCDMPFLPGDLLERLAGSIGDAGVAVAASGGQPHPVCALWSVEALREIGAYRQEGRRSLKGLAKRVGIIAVAWPQGAFANVNTPEELAEAERRIESEVENLE